MKTHNLNRKAIEHLLIIGYTINVGLEKILDAPYLIFTTDGIIEPCYSAQYFRDIPKQLKTQEQILKLRPKGEREEFKKLSKREKGFYQLLNRLNTLKVSNITGYDVSWTIQRGMYGLCWEILPISPFACGSISMEHLEVILDFAKNNEHLSIALSYTDWNEEKKRYGTSTPCIILNYLLNINMNRFLLIVTIMLLCGISVGKMVTTNIKDPLFLCWTISTIILVIVPLIVFYSRFFKNLL